MRTSPVRFRSLGGVGGSGQEQQIEAIRVVALQWVSADFTVNSPSLSMMAGTQSSATLTVTALNGFYSSVSFNQTSRPAGLALSFSPNRTTGSTSAIVTAASNLGHVLSRV